MDVFEFKVFNWLRNLLINSVVNVFGFFSDFIIVVDYLVDFIYIVNWFVNWLWSFVDLLDNFWGIIKCFFEFVYGKKINVIIGYK